MNLLASEEPEDRPARILTMIQANKTQPDICMSLSSSWIVAMMKSERTGEAWCATINAAPADGELYQKHKEDQAELTSIALIRQVSKIQGALRIFASIPAVGAPYAQDLLGFGVAMQPVLQSLQDKTTDKIKLLRVRGLKVLRSKADADLDDLKKEFLKLDEAPRYYLISVRATVKSHTIAVASTLRPGIFFGTRGAIYYYDSNLFRVLEFDDARELNRFLDRALLRDYRSVNSIWQVACAAPN
jgi:hypothetical protein